uniref:keratin-associated protein 9-6-like n=1 Tax=Styela clava TaxID=7725 RepID=UPI0019398C09|nr:keratin-associated protein 9-6-like [Styela clava]
MILIAIFVPDDTVCSLSETCKDRCFNRLSDNENECRCDYRCSSYNNCCDDYVDICLQQDTAKVSCFGRCYEPSTVNVKGRCACDKQCSITENCCDDYVPVCASLITCENRCGAPRDITLQCQCDANCMNRFDCCMRYAVECGGISEETSADSIHSCQDRCFETDTTIESSCSCKSTCQESQTCCHDYFFNAWIQQKTAIMLIIQPRRWQQPNRGAQALTNSQNSGSGLQFFQS